MDYRRIFLILLCVMLSAALLTSSGSPPEKYWVFFTDKDTALLVKASRDVSFQRTLVSERSLKRRGKMPGDLLIHETDLPVSVYYLERMAKLGLKPVIISKWLNAGSFYLTGSQVELVRNLPFVREVRKVARYGAPKPAVEQPLNVLQPLLRKDVPQLYGSSYTQNKIIGTTDVHQAGITGRGILIGMLDTGYNLNHEALEYATVIAEYDFINNDEVTSNETGQDVPDQDSHGTAILSVIAGYKEGRLLGSAYGARFALAKTEDNSGETSIEEDYWVAGIEWLDSLGVDVVSSSLGYTDFTDVSYYTPADMDGNTAVTTISADLAAEKGIVVVVSAGNEGMGPWRIISAPADGNNVLAVGAVYSDSTIVYFSSRGPTADGRIKPDLVAQGFNVYSASSGSYTGYAPLNGTSLACPLAAGTAALILSAHSELTSFQVMDALKETASQSSAPDNTYGWGVIDAFSAVTYFGPAFSNIPEVEIIPEGNQIITSVISKIGLDNSTLRLYYAFGEGAPFTSVPLTPTEVESKYSALIPAVTEGMLIKFYFRGEDIIGKETVFPGESGGSSFELISGDSVVTGYPGGRRTVPTDFILSANYPNPFNNTTTIEVGLKKAAVLNITIYNIRGMHVRTLHTGSLSAGTHFFSWDGTNDSGRIVASGVYLYRMTVPGFTKTRKMTFVR